MKSIVFGEIIMKKIRKKIKKWMLVGVSGAIALAMGSVAFAGKLVINNNQADPAPKKAWTELVEDFKKAHPEVEVEFNTYDHESYKTSIRNWLTSEPPDVVNWFAGERLNTFVSRGLIEDISDVWDANNMHDDFPSSRGPITFDGKQYAVPWAYYQWGVYYRKDLFEKYGIAVPTTWDEFLKACATLKSNGITPITIGTKHYWTAAGWFDYLNFRINGMDFHRELLAGNASYTDQRVKDVFAKWRELLDPGYFIENHTSYSWQEAIPALLQGKAAMYLIGNFVVWGMAAEDLAKIDYFQFPTINPNLPKFEDAPTEIVAIPKGAKNKANAKKFMAFIGRADVQSKLNSAMSMLPPNTKAKPKPDRFLEIGAKVLASAAATAQFYDRDSKPEMATEGMKGFQEYMDKPDRLDKILTRLDKSRKRIFKK